MPAIVNGRRARPGVVLVVLAIATTLLAACGSDSKQTSTTTACVGGGSFGDVPSPGSLTPTGPATTSGTTTQSFQVDGMDAASTFELYERELPAEGWTQQQAGPSGGADFRGVWTRDQVQLTVSTAPIGQSGDRCQLSLQSST